MELAAGIRWAGRSNNSGGCGCSGNGAVSRSRTSARLLHGARGSLAGSMTTAAATPDTRRLIARQARRAGRTRQQTACRLSPFEPPPFDSRKLNVKFLDGSGAQAPPPTVTRRCYTLTHNDLTGELFLSVGSRFDDKQISGWYNVFLRDEILAEWRGDGLHVHCHVSASETWWLAPGRLRNFIFCREMPLVLDCLRYAERQYFSDHPQLPTSATNIHFHAQEEALDRTEQWGPLELATGCLTVTYSTCETSLPYWPTSCRWNPEDGGGGGDTPNDGDGDSAPGPPPKMAVGVGAVGMAAAEAAADAAAEVTAAVAAAAGEQNGSSRVKGEPLPFDTGPTIMCQPAFSNAGEGLKPVAARQSQR